MLFHEQIGFHISYSRLRYILMGGSVLAALLIISIGKWGGDEALHCAAEKTSLQEFHTIKRENVFRCVGS